jgi:excisionase family DNA binding protein
VTTNNKENAELLSEGLVSVTYAREYLGVCRATIYVLMDKGELAYTKIGGSRRIPRKALVALAEKNLVAK